MKIYPAIHKNPLNGWNGYLIIEDFPQHLQGKGSPYANSPYAIGNPHGGITCISTTPKFKKDFIFIAETPKNMESCILLGFDTCHYDDTPERWSKEAVIEETLTWKNEVEELDKAFANDKYNTLYRIITKINTEKIYQFSIDLSLFTSLEYGNNQDNLGTYIKENIIQVFHPELQASCAIEFEEEEESDLLIRAHVYKLVTKSVHSVKKL